MEHYLLQSTKEFVRFVKELQMFHSFFLPQKLVQMEHTRKKGNYICHDSDQCNQQLVQLAPFTNSQNE